MLRTRPRGTVGSGDTSRRQRLGASGDVTYSELALGADAWLGDPDRNGRNPKQRGNPRDHARTRHPGQAHTTKYNGDAERPSTE